jgi:hypothetical protein
MGNKREEGTNQGRDPISEGIQTQECNHKYSFEIGKKDNNDNDDTFQGLKPVVICPIVDFYLLFTSTSSYFLLNPSITVD